jgi:thiamine-phosphate pyrophosphorylase
MLSDFFIVIHHSSHPVSLQLPRIYPITDCRLSGLSHHEQVARLVDGEAAFIQLRDKQDAPRDFFIDAIEALRIARSAKAKLIINDRVDIALAINADGVHLGQTDMPVKAARRLLGTNAIIGFSAHNLEQVKAALDLPIDYLAFGPIFQTTSKENPDPIAGISQLAAAKRLVGSLPLVAIGGIDSTNLSEVLAAGADSAAVLSAVLKDPAQITQNLRNLQSSASNNSR